MNCCLGFFWDPFSRGVDGFLQSTTGEAASWLWSLVAGGILNLILLASRAEELDRETRVLIAVRTDLQVQISSGKVGNKTATQQAKTWLREAEEMGARATDFLFSYQQRGDISEGSSLRSSYRLSCEAAECLKQVRRLKSERSSLPDLIQAPPPAVVPLEGSSNDDSVGAEETLSKIRRLVMEDDKAGIIGIYGMGGIGKTTLLKEINDELLQRGPGGFDLVIWVTVSKNLDVLKVQDDIADRLGYSGPALPEDPTGRVNTLVRAQSQRKILLLLDDIWEKIDLGALGISRSFFRNGSKLVFTTRSLEVCNRMGAQGKVKVPILNRANSWELFCQKVGRREDQWDPSIRSLAEAVCKKCGGLPITLITVGRAMAEATTRGEWDEALMALKGIPVELGDMKEVLTILKFSFDKLTGKLRECLLYCALFPEDSSIEIDDLIEYWVGEGLLESEYSPDSIDRARNCGLRIITSLKSACLLEDGHTKGEHVKLHDTVREMALWITSGKCDGEKGNVFLVNTRERLSRVPMPERWTEATRISLMLNEISVLPERPQCHNLQTLLLTDNHPLKEIPVGFFQFMPRLGVLDLSATGISHLPPGIGSLVELRYLDLSNTSLESLPVELGRLTKLRQLRLEKTSGLKSIPREAVSSLAGLQSLKMDGSGYEWRGGWEEGDDEGRQLSLKDLDGMGQLTELNLYIINGMTQEGMQALQKNSGRLFASIRSLWLKEVGSKSFDLSTCLEIMKGLRKLWVVNCPHLEELILNTNQLSHCPQLETLWLWELPLARISWTDGNVSERGPSTPAICKCLVTLDIWECDALEDITWIRDLPCIQSISLGKCSKIEELLVVEEVMMGQNVADFENDSFFPKLKRIYLKYLPNLRSICRRPLLFPSLEIIEVGNCPELKKLPFGLPSANNITEIRGEQEWWDSLEWDHEEVRSKFTPYFQPFRWSG